jgi:peptidoglycan/LPS O-acetylase OafA/YrhL
MIIYGFGLLGGSKGWASRRLIVLGQYSLVAYIGQIGVFQVYTHVFGRPEPTFGNILLMFGVALSITLLAVELIGWARARSKSLQLFYRAIAP